MQKVVADPRNRLYASFYNSSSKLHYKMFYWDEFEAKNEAQAKLGVPFPFTG